MARKSPKAARGRGGAASMGDRRCAQRLFQQALDAHRQARIADAERLYREVLGAEARHVGALQHLGILAQQRGDVDESVRLLTQAAAITPSDPLLQNNLGNALRSQGNAALATSAYRAAVASDAGYVNALYNLAGLLHEQGEGVESEACYRRVVALDPSDVGAWMGLGMTLLDQGREDDALPCFERTVALRPEDPVCQYNLGNALKTVERMDDAIAAFRRAVSISPDYAEAHHNLGMALGSSGDNDGAESEFREALRYRPDYAVAWVSLASILHHRGDHGDAEELCRKALGIDPDQLRALRVLALSLRAQHRDEEALQTIRRAVEIEPVEIDSRVCLGELLLEFDHFGEATKVLEPINAEKPFHAAALSALTKAYMGLNRTSAAIALCRKAIAEDADRANAYCDLGLALRQTDDTPAAIEALQAAIRIDPDYAEAHNNLGIAYQDAGDMERAIESFREALEVVPGMTVALFNISHTRRFDETDLPEISRIEALLEKSDMPDDGRMYLHFALGKMLDNCARYDQAFEHYRQANRYKRKHRRFNPEHHRRWSAKLLEVFTPAYFETHTGLGDASQRPVFIVGMPRSGTSLVEQILASHPEVHGAGELTAISETLNSIEARIGNASEYPDFVPSLDDGALQWGARRYLDSLQSIDDQAARVTDKMPGNFCHLGIIAAMLPGAHVIHCRRDAMDVCLSNFVQLFAEGHYYAYDLSDIAIYYRRYEQLMSHWREVLPIQMVEVQYEELIDDQEGISRALVEHIGLEWDDRCLAFHENKRAVRTASNWQVRQPIYKTGRKRWKNYEKNLTQLKSDLHYVEDA